MKTKMILLLPDGLRAESEVELGEPPSIDELHAVLDPLLGTTDFEHVLIYAGKKAGLGPAYYRDMFVDETGALQELPRNEAATELYRRNSLMHAKKPGEPEDLPAIYGPAVFFPDRVVWL